MTKTRTRKPPKTTGKAGRAAVQATTRRQQQVIVTVTVSQPYTVIGGGWTGLRPQGRRRDYRASYQGHDIKRTSKDEMGRYLRQLAYQAGERVRIEFVEEVS
jgi:hypothetical protein